MTSYVETKTDVLQWGLVALGVYLVYKISKAGSGISDAITGAGTTINYWGSQAQDAGNKANDYLVNSATTINNEAANFNQKLNNAITATLQGTNKQVQQIAGKNSSYKGFEGVLTVDNLGYSVSAEKAVSMTGQILNNKQTFSSQKSQPLLSSSGQKIVQNPYTNLR